MPVGVPAGADVHATDKNGVTAPPAPVAVPRGADRVTLEATFVIPEGSSRACAAAVLDADGITLVEPPPEAARFCMSVTP